MNIDTKEPSMTRRSFLPLLAVVAGCYHYVHEGIEPRQLGSQQRVKIWSNDTVSLWRAVAITRDSISGIPLNKSSNCKTCRLARPRQAVDSIRVAYPKVSPGQEVVWGGVWLAGVIALLALDATTR